MLDQMPSESYKTTLSISDNHLSETDAIRQISVYQYFRMLSIFVLMIVLNIFSIHNVHSQQNQIDSFEQIIDTISNPCDKLSLLSNVLTKMYIFYDLDRGLNRIPEMLELIDECKNADVNMLTYADLGYVYYRLNEIDSAFMFLKMADTSNLSQIDYVVQSKFHGVNAICHHKNGNIDKSLQCHQRSLQAAYSSNKYSRIGSVLNNIGTIYRNRSQNKTASDYFRRGISELEKDSSAQRLLATALSNLMRTTDDKMENQMCFEKTLAIFKEMKIPSEIQRIYCTQAIYLYEKKKYEQAIFLAKKGLSGDRRSFDEFDCVLCLAGAYLERSEANKAKEHLDYVENNIKSQPNKYDITDQYHLAGMWSEYYNQKKDYKNAFEKQLERYDHFDSIQYASNSSFTSEFQVKYETAEKEKQLFEQQLLTAQEMSKRIQQKSLLMGLLGSVLLLGLYLFNKQKQKRQKTQHELQLKNVEANALKELDQLKSHWFENLSHDIRTPLTLVSAPIKDALKTTKSSSTRNLLEIADRNSQHLIQLTNEMLELARLENNIIPVREQSKTALIELKKMIHAFESYSVEQKVNIEDKVDIDENLILRFDFDKYEKVFNNLFKNAVKYSPESTTVTVDIRYKNETLITKIKDEGHGISKEELPYLFDKYFRASNHQSQTIEGSGLGLSIVKELVDLMSGNIIVESKIGNGSLFSFSIPVKIDHSDEIVKQQVEQIEQNDTSALPSISGVSNILIVEDNIEMRRFLNSALANMYNTKAVPNASIALQVLEDQSFDLIISDIMMPGIDGFTFRKRVNAIPKLTKTPFIFLSAKALDSDKLDGLKLGVDDYITKPFITDELVIRINNLLARQIARQETDNSVNTEDSIIEKSMTLVHKTRSIIITEIKSPNFGVSTLAKKLLYSERQLNRLIKKETGLTVVQYILEVRLQIARELLLTNTYYSAKEVMHQVGINSQSYFNRKFNERFGIPPGQMMHRT